MIRRVLTLAALLAALSGCAPIPLTLLSAGMGAVAGALRLDDDVFNAWVAAKGLETAPVGTCKAPATSTKPAAFPMGTP